MKGGRTGMLRTAVWIVLAACWAGAALRAQEVSKLAPEVMAQRDAQRTGYFPGAMKDKKDPLITTYLFCGAKDDRLYALEHVRGDRLWGKVLGGVLGAIAVDKGFAYVAGGDGNLTCIEINTGGVVWQKDYGCSGRTSPVILDGVIYFGAKHPRVYAIDTAKGDVVWKTELPGWIACSVAVAGEKVFAACKDNKLYCLDLKQGGKLWETEIGNAYFSDIVVAGERVYCGAHDKKFHALNAADGKLLWTAAFEGVPAIPAVSGGLVYVPAATELRALNADNGETVWSKTCGGKLGRSAAVCDGEIYFGTAEGFVYGLKADTGDELWKTQVEGKIEAGPAAAKGCVYIGDMDGDFHSLDSETGALKWTRKFEGAVSGLPVVAD